jgi:N-acetyl-alpha-D-muramate 1-phosphate uridylyltransferase
LAEQIPATHSATAAAFGLRIQLLARGSRTAGDRRRHLPTRGNLLGDAPFLVTNGDVYAEFDYASVLPALADMASNPNHRAHLILVDNPPHHPSGDFVLRDGLSFSPLRKRERGRG